MPLQNFVDGSTPLIGAAWLNKVDVLMFTVFQEASTATAARTALGGTATGVSLFTAVSASTALDALGAGATGKTMLAAVNAAGGRTAIGAAALAGLSTQDFAAALLTADKITLSAGSTTRAPIVLTAGTNQTTAGAGTTEYDGKAFYDTAQASGRGLRRICHFSALSADFVGTDVNTAQPFFDTTQDVITLNAATSYEFEMQISMSRSAGTNAHTIGILFGGTATLNSIGYVAESTTTTGNVLGAASKITGDAATAVTVTPSDNNATENNTFLVKGIVRVNAAGTFIPQFIYSAAPGGAPTIRANSFIKFFPLGSNTVTFVGNWA